MSGYGTPERGAYAGRGGLAPSGGASSSSPSGVGGQVANSGGPPGGGVAAGGGAHVHALAFRVMRLCRPALHVEAPLRLAEEDLRADPAPGERGAPPGRTSAATTGAPHPFAYRTDLAHPEDALGIGGLLVLPQSFGTIYLGETFCSYISVGNYSDHAVSAVGIKAELQTERKRIVLYDNTNNLLPMLPSQGRHDFIVEHDLKEIGTHTLVCSTVYTDSDQERKYLPQYFKFTVANPLAVRTKVRHLADCTLLEACIENCTRNPLFLNSVRFESSAMYTTTPIQVEPAKPAAGNGVPEDQPSGIISASLREMIIVKANSGARYFLFRLKKVAVVPGSEADNSGSTLGKLEIQWRLNMGEPGRLQTQQILGGLTTNQPDVSVTLVSIPDKVVVEHPFLVKCVLCNHTDQTRSPLRLLYTQEASSAGVVADGLWPDRQFELAPGEQREEEIRLVAVTQGVQRISGVAIAESVKDPSNHQVLDTMQAVEVFVEAE